MLSPKLMFCPDCGTPITNDTLFCPSCGKNLSAEQAAAPAAPVYQEAAQPETPATPATENEYASQDSFTYSSFDQVPTKRKGGFGIGKIVAIVAAVGVAVGLAFSAKWIWRNIQKLVAPDAYTRNVEKDEAKEMASDVAKVYGKVLASYEDQVAAEMKIELNISDNVLNLLENSIPEDVGIDPEIINDIALTYGINTDDNLMELILALDYKDKALVNVSGIMDMESQAMYVALTNLSKYYLEISSEAMGLEDPYGGAVAVQRFDYEQVQEVLGKIVDALPSEEELDALLVKYTQIVFDNIDDVNKSSEKVEIDGVSQSLTTLEYEIDTKTVMKVAKAVLKEAKNDKDLKKIIKNVLEALVEEGLITGDPDDMYDAFQEGIEFALDSMGEMDIDNEDLFTLTSYVDGSHNIVGRKIEVEDTDVEIRFVTVTKGKKIAREISVEGPGLEAEISGSGTKKGTIENVEYTVEVNGEELVEIAVSDLETEPMEKGSYQGKIVITPTEEIMEMLLEDAGIPDVALSMLNLDKPGISFEFSGNEKSMKYSFGILGDGDALAEVILTISTKSAKSISLPDDSKIIDMDNADEYLQTIDMDEIADILKELGLPKDLIDQLEEGFAQKDTAIGYPAVEEDYYYYGY